MKKHEIKKAHERAVNQHMRKAIHDHAKSEAYHRVADALAEGRHDKDQPGHTTGHEHAPVEHSTEHARKTHTEHIHSAAIEHKLGRG